MIKNVKTLIKNIKAAGSVLINGTTVEVCAGDSISISGDGNQVTVGSKTATVNSSKISISITGDVERVEGIGDVKIGGNVTGDVSTSAGSIEIGGDVGGDVDSACGNVTVKGKVAGDVDVSCGNVKVGK